MTFDAFGYIYTAPHIPTIIFQFKNINAG